MPVQENEPALNYYFTELPISNPDLWAWCVFVRVIIPGGGFGVGEGVFEH